MKIKLFFFLFALFSMPIQAAPSITHWTASSGARVYFVPIDSLPMIDIQVDFAAGAAFDPPQKLGVAAFTQGLLDAGVDTKAHTKTQQSISVLSENAIAEAFADLGAEISGSVNKDRSSLSLRSLSNAEQKKPAIALLAALLAAPSYPEKSLAREKARLIESLKEAATRPESIASHAFSQALYGNHPYGQLATPETIARITRADLVQFHRQFYNAKLAIVTIVGNVSQEEASSIAEELTQNLPRNLLSSLPKSADENSFKIPAVLNVPTSLKTDVKTAREIKIAHPASQAHISLGQASLKRGDPDFFALITGNYILGGGGFMSRLMHEVREKRGLVYGISSGFAPMREAGVFSIVLQTKKSQAAEAILLTKEVLADFLKNGVTEEELTAAKENLRGSFPLRIDSNAKILANVANIAFYDLPLNYLETYQDNIQKVTAKEIAESFARHVDLEQLITVIVGGQ